MASVKCLESNISEVRTEVFMVVRRIIVFGIAVGINTLEHPGSRGARIPESEFK